VSEEDKRKAAVEEWKGRVKVSVRERGERLWIDRLCTKVKAAVYLDLKQKPGWEDYLDREEFGEEEGCALNSEVVRCC
jgi:hypothetical protein